MYWQVKDHSPLSKVELLQRRVIVADCYLYIALIHFIKQDLTGCLAVLVAIHCFATFLSHQSMGDQLVVI